MKLVELNHFDPTFELFTTSSDDVEILGITDSSAFLPKHLYFVKNKTFLELLMNCAHKKEIGLVIEKKFYQSLELDKKEQLKSLLWWIAGVEDVNVSMSLLSKPFFDEKFPNSINDVVDGRQMGSATIHPTALIAQGVFIGDSVIISADVKLHPGVVIMSGVSIGERTEIFPNTVVYRNVKIGKDVRIHANSIVGSDGFGYNFSKGVHLKVWHMGSVIIGDEVEIGASTSIDAGTFSPTIIGRGCKFDNQVQIGHNCKLGVGVIMCGHAGIGGSTTVGDYTVFGGRAAASNGLVIGSKAQIAGGAGVTNNVADGAVVGGFPARDIKEWMKGVAMLRKLSLPKSKTEESGS